MDIDYDSTEIDEDELPTGILGLTRNQRWNVSCSAHGLLETADDGSREEHDRMIAVWARHRAEVDGDGKPELTIDEYLMTFASEDD